MSDETEPVQPDADVQPAPAPEPTPAPPAPPVDPRPERKVGKAFAGGLVFALTLKRLAKRRHRS